MLASHAEVPELREQFETPEQQKEISTLGMWIFLVTEIMFFGGLFLAYTVYRRDFAAVFGLASNTLNIVIGAVNTAVLLCSSFTMVLAVRAAQIGSRKALIIFLILTIYSGRSVSWASRPMSGTRSSKSITCPDRRFIWKAPGAQGPAQLFFSLYFTMTGPARPAHGGRRGTDAVSTVASVRRQIQPVVLHAGRYRRLVLALCRYHLDLSVSACSI